MPVSFHNEEIHFDLKQKSRVRSWVSRCINKHGRVPGDIAIIFTSDAQILRINREFLNHDYFTDVITFDYSGDDMVSGDIFIGIEQVKENAKFYNTAFEEELHRVMIHGVLHLLGFGDATESEKDIMREMENEALNLW